jgi:hypothetical protein
MATKRSTTRTTKAGRKASARKSSDSSSVTRKWSAEVLKKSDALDLKSGVFTLKNPHSIALSLKKSAESSQRRKAGPYQSAMSMLNFEINRAGKNLSAERREVLNKAKVELRKVFHRLNPQ